MRGWPIALLVIVLPSAASFGRGAVDVIREYLAAFPTDVRPLPARKRWKALAGTDCTYDPGHLAYRPVTCAVDDPADGIARIELTMEENARVLDMLIIRFKPGAVTQKPEAILDLLPGKRGKVVKEKGRNAVSHSVDTAYGSYGLIVNDKTGPESLLLTSGNDASIRDFGPPFRCPDAAHGYREKDAAKPAKLGETLTVTRWCEGRSRYLTFVGTKADAPPAADTGAWHRKILEVLRAFVGGNPEEHRAWTEMAQILEEEAPLSAPNLPKWGKSAQLAGFRYGSFGLNPTRTADGFEVGIEWAMPEGEPSH